MRLIDSCITQLKAQGPARTCNESKPEEDSSVNRSRVTRGAALFGVHDWGRGGRGGGWQGVKRLCPPCLHSRMVESEAPTSRLCLRLADSCITQLKVQGPSRTCNESKEEEEEEDLSLDELMHCRPPLVGSCCAVPIQPHCRREKQQHRYGSRRPRPAPASPRALGLPIHVLLVCDRALRKFLRPGTRPRVADVPSCGG